MISVERRNATAHSSLERGQGRLHRHMRYDTWMSTRNGQTSTALCCCRGVSLVGQSPMGVMMLIFHPRPKRFSKICNMGHRIYASSNPSIPCECKVSILARTTREFHAVPLEPLTPVSVRRHCIGTLFA